MKTIKLFSILAMLLAITQFSFAQTQTEKIPVSGNCGMCKSNIEKAAKKAGANSAEWDMDAKVLTVSYKNSSTDAAKIQQAVAAVGYDTRDFKAADAAYDKLHACCKYERAAADKDKASTCCAGKCEMKDGKCEMKDGKTPDGKLCAMDCCKDGACTKKS